jgi:hypothetical protein
MNPLAQYDREFNLRGYGTKLLANGMYTVIPNGRYTLDLPDGSERILRVHTRKVEAKFRPGERLLSLLIGPARTSDYESFATVNDSGIDVFMKSQRDFWMDLAATVWLLATGCEADGYTLRIVRHCLVCNGLLRTDESKRKGVGPGCQKKIEEITNE